MLGRRLAADLEAPLHSADKRGREDLCKGTHAFAAGDAKDWEDNTAPVHLHSVSPPGEPPEPGTPQSQPEETGGEIPPEGKRGPERTPKSPKRSHHLPSKAEKRSQQSARQELQEPPSTIRWAWLR